MLAKYFTFIFCTLIYCHSLNATEGVIVPYPSSSDWSSRYIKVGCRYYNHNMELVEELPFLMCKPIQVSKRRFFIFKESQRHWFIMDGEIVALLNDKKEMIWSRQGSFNHDITWDPENQILWAIQDDKRDIGGRSYNYFSLHGYNLKGEEVKTWYSYEHLGELQKYGNWKDVGEVKFPLTSRSSKRDDVLMANFIKWQSRPWNTGDGKTIERGSLLLNLRYLNVLLSLDSNLKIAWSYHFNPNPKDADAFDVHTPELSDNGKIIAFINSIKIDNKARSGIFSYDTAKTADPKLIYLIPVRYPDQEARTGAFGSVQVLNDNSLFISTGSEYGSIVHLDQSSDIIFEWLNPKLTKKFDDKPTSEYPVPIYRASLEELNWIKKFK